MLSELYWYIHQELSPPDASSTSETLECLQACHQLFEAGFLSHERIMSLNSPVLQRIEKGYEYFTSWLSTLLTEGYIHFILIKLTVCMDVLPADTDFPHTSARQNTFLSWQSEYETLMLI